MSEGFNNRTGYASKPELLKMLAEANGRLHLLSRVVACLIDKHDELLPIALTTEELAKAPVDKLRLKTIDDKLVVTREDLEG